MKSIETYVWLIRHGTPEEGVRGRCYGDLDVGLSTEGTQEMEELGRQLARLPLQAIYVSPKRRAAQSAALISKFRDCPVNTVAALSEIHFGLFEGRSYDDIAVEYPEIYRQWMESPTEVRFPEGESFAQMLERVTVAARSLRLKHAGESIALVTHGGVIRILLAEALSLEPRHIFRVAQRYGAINLITYFGEEPTVELVNAHGHALLKSMHDKNFRHS